jgi:hypothetical protein
VTVVGPPGARPADGLAVDFVVESDRAQLGEIVRRVRDGRLRRNLGTVATLDDALAAGASSSSSSPRRPPGRRPTGARRVAPGPVSRSALTVVMDESLLARALQGIRGRPWSCTLIRVSVRSWGWPPDRRCWSGSASSSG